MPSITISTLNLKISRPYGMAFLADESATCIFSFVTVYVQTILGLGAFETIVALPRRRTAAFAGDAGGMEVGRGHGWRAPRGGVIIHRCPASLAEQQRIHANLSIAQTVTGSRGYR